MNGICRSLPIDGYHGQDPRAGPSYTVDLEVRAHQEGGMWLKARALQPGPAQIVKRISAFGKRSIIIMVKMADQTLSYWKRTY